MNRDAVVALMKRCQRGVGGRDALDDAHSIMAECYGTLGRLQADLDDAVRRANATASALAALHRICLDCDLDSEAQGPTEDEYTAAMDAAEKVLRDGGFT